MHYLPDDPESSQMINVASLILSQNGIWGDLLKISGQGIDRIGSILRKYKTVCDEITESYPIQTERLEARPKIYENKRCEPAIGAVVTRG